MASLTRATTGRRARGHDLACFAVAAGTHVTQKLIDSAGAASRTTTWVRPLAQVAATDLVTLIRPWADNGAVPLASIWLFPECTTTMDHWYELGGIRDVMDAERHLDIAAWLFHGARQRRRLAKRQLCISGRRLVQADVAEEHVPLLSLRQSGANHYGYHKH